MPKKRKGAEKKKGKKGRVLRGNAASYMTRNQALRKLQLSLPEFRKLCILKGIFPREPKNAPKGKDKTYYLRKDIMYIMHDPLLPKLRAFRTWKKKVKKYKDKRMTEKVAALKKQKPRYSLVHVVKERYPTFQDALRDIDDALCTVFLFANMPSTVKIHSARVERCQQLAREFQFYVVKTNSLRKVFLSTKGIYFQAVVQGQTLTWVVPYHFTQQIVKDVDYKVMMTFLEFYELLMGYVNFKLFHDLNLTYPPKFDADKDANAEGLEAIVDELKTAGAATKGPVITKKKESAKEAEKRLSALSDLVKNIAAQEESSASGDEEGDSEESDNENESEDEESEGADSDEEKGNTNWSAGPGELDTFGDDETSRLIKENALYGSLFAKCHFFLNREVPREAFEFVIKSFGGRVSWDNPSTPNAETDPSITHHLIDRPTVSNRLLNRDYIQPQWVVDCVNSKVLIPVDEYVPGHTLPPHLSPFVDDSAEGYIPDYRKRLEAYYAEANGGVLPTRSAAPSIPLDEPNSESDEEDEEKFNEELEEEQKGNYGKAQGKGGKGPKAANFPAKVPTKAQKRAREEAEDEAEQQETASALLPNKKRRLLERIKYSKRMKQEEIDKLESKKTKLAEGKAKIGSDGVISYVKDKDGDAVMSDD